MSLLRELEFVPAAVAMLEGAEAARSQGNPLRSARFLNAAGGAYLLALQFREALQCFARADALMPELLKSATGSGRTSVVDLAAAISVNRASLYIELLDAETASSYLDQASERLGDRPRYRAQWMVLKARAAGARKEWEAASDLLRAAADLAANSGQWDVLATALSSLGQTEIALERHAAAERALLEAFRIRVLQKLPGRAQNLRSLGVVALGRDRLEEATQYLSHAAAYSREEGAADSYWQTLALQAEVLERQGRLHEALRRYREAMQEAERWRAGLVPAYTTMTEADVSAGQMAGRYSDLAALLARMTGSRALTDESLLAVERQRAASILRLSSRRGGSNGLDAGYLAAVSRLRRLEMSTRPEDYARRTALRREVTLMEARLLPGFDPGGHRQHVGRSAEELRRALGREEAAISYFVASGRTWRWAVSAAGVQLEALPDAARLHKAIANFRAKPSREAGRKLGRLLLRNLPQAVRGAHLWHLSLDGPLFELPFAALVMEGGEDDGRFVIERHAVQSVPSLMALLRPSAETKIASVLNVADAVYNRADPRYPEPPGSRFPLALSFWGQDRKGLSVSAVPERARLAASAAEVQKLTKFWRARGVPVQNLTGLAAEAGEVAAALERRPSVVHIAAHIDPGSQPAFRSHVLSAALEGRPYVALSRKLDGSSDALRPEALMRLRLPGSLVVLNGCDSGRGLARPGLGLTGLAQAWLLGGASSVLGSLWPVPDDASPLFLAFYQAVVDGVRPAEALRQAQMASLQSGGWRAEPSYWGAWVMTTNK